MHRRSWVVPLLVVVSLGAAGHEASLVDAVKEGDVGQVRVLLQRHVDSNMREVDGTTALHWAARLDDTAAASLLIAAGADVKAENRYGVTPLYLACLNGNEAIIEGLLAAGADANAALEGGE